MGIPAIDRPVGIFATLPGTGGNDTLTGGPDDDFIFGWDGHDSLQGQDGADTILGGAGNDTIEGGKGADILHGGDGNDSIDGGGGDDLILGSGGDDSLGGGSGQDIIFGASGADYLQGGDNDDILIGGEGNDTLEGGAGNDVLHGGNGLDVLDGGDGDDLFLFAGATTDSDPDHRVVVLGGDGIDTVDFRGSGEDNFYSIQDVEVFHLSDNGMSIDLDAPNYTVAVTIHGGEGNDTIGGTYFDDDLLGGGGDDELFGYYGDDTLTGGDGADLFAIGFDFTIVTDFEAGVDSWAISQDFLDALGITIGQFSLLAQLLGYQNGNGDLQLDSPDGSASIIFEGIAEVTDVIDDLIVL